MFVASRLFAIPDEHSGTAVSSASATTTSGGLVAVGDPCCGNLHFGEWSAKGRQSVVSSRSGPTPGWLRFPLRDPAFPRLHCPHSAASIPRLPQLLSRGQSAGYPEGHAACAHCDGGPACSQFGCDATLSPGLNIVIYGSNMGPRNAGGPAIGIERRCQQRRSPGRR